eukprot:Rhum_TRINITY_DN23262_c0_g1::Rhum_TRINITY_DN23262_c0_g1_i1::g.177595::m.177595
MRRAARRAPPSLFRKRGRHKGRGGGGGGVLVEYSQPLHTLQATPAREKLLEMLRLGFAALHPVHCHHLLLLDVALHTEHVLTLRALGRLDRRLLRRLLVFLLVFVDVVRRTLLTRLLHALRHPLLRAAVRCLGRLDLLVQLPHHVAHGARRGVELRLRRHDGAALLAEAQRVDRLDRVDGERRPGHHHGRRRLATQHARQQMGQLAVLVRDVHPVTLLTRVQRTDTLLQRKQTHVDVNRFLHADPVAVVLVPVRLLLNVAVAFLGGRVLVDVRVDGGGGRRRLPARRRHGRGSAGLLCVLRTTQVGEDHHGLDLDARVAVALLQREDEQRVRTRRPLVHERGGTPLLAVALADQLRHVLHRVHGVLGTSLEHPALGGGAVLADGVTLVEEVVHLVTEDLHVREAQLRRHAVRLLPHAHRLQHLRARLRHDARLLARHTLAEHRVRLARSGLAEHDAARVRAVDEVAHHPAARRSVHAGLRGLALEHGVELEGPHAHPGRQRHDAAHGLVGIQHLRLVRGGVRCAVRGLLHEDAPGLVRVGDAVRPLDAAKPLVQGDHHLAPSAGGLGAGELCGDATLVCGPQTGADVHVEALARLLHVGLVRDRVACGRRRGGLLVSPHVAAPEGVEKGFLARHAVAAVGRQVQRPAVAQRRVHDAPDVVALRVERGSPRLVEHQQVRGRAHIQEGHHVLHEVRRLCPHLAALVALPSGDFSNFPHHFDCCCAAVGCCKGIPMKYRYCSFY